jgi:hypothetical protein
VGKVPPQIAEGGVALVNPRISFQIPSVVDNLINRLSIMVDERIHTEFIHSAESKVAMQKVRTNYQIVTDKNNSKALRPLTVSSQVDADQRNIYSKRNNPRRRTGHVHLISQMNSGRFGLGPLPQRYQFHQLEPVDYVCDLFCFPVSLKTISQVSAMLSK